jgi:hypothetical protein
LEEMVTEGSEWRDQDEEWEDEGYGPTPEERIARRRRLLWLLTAGVVSGAATWVANRIVSLILERPEVTPTEGTARVLEWTVIIERASYGLMIGCLVVLAALLLLDVLHRRYASDTAPADIPGTRGEETAEPSALAAERAVLLDELEDDDLTEADLTNDELAEILRSERAMSQRDLGRAVVVGSRIALLILALAAITWATVSSAAAFFFPLPADLSPLGSGTTSAPELDYGTYLRLSQIAETARNVGLAMVALLGGGVLVHELSSRLNGANVLDTEMARTH